MRTNIDNKAKKAVASRLSIHSVGVDCNWKLLSVELLGGNGLIVSIRSFDPSVSRIAILLLLFSIYFNPID